VRLFADSMHWNAINIQFTKEQAASEELIFFHALDLPKIVRFIYFYALAVFLVSQ